MTLANPTRSTLVVLAPLPCLCAARALSAEDMGLPIQAGRASGQGLCKRQSHALSGLSDLLHRAPPTPPMHGMLTWKRET